MLNFTKIRPLEFVIFHTDKTDGHDEACSRFWARSQNCEKATITFTTFLYIYFIVYNSVNTTYKSKLTLHVST